MKRAQFAPGITMTIIAWLMLAIIILLLLILRTDGKAADTPLTAVEVASTEVGLSTYLKMPVSLGKDQVPMAELIVHAVLTNSDEAVKTETNRFLALAERDARQKIVITLPDSRKWTYGNTVLTGTSANTTLLTPTHSTIKIEFFKTTLSAELERLTEEAGSAVD